MPPPRVFAIVAGRHWGQRSAKLNPTQLQRAFDVVHEQYQSGYRGLRLRRNIAMRMSSFCNTNSLMFLALPAIAGQLVGLYRRWRVKEGHTEASGTFAISKERPPSSQTISARDKKAASKATSR